MLKGTQCFKYYWLREQVTVLPGTREFMLTIGKVWIQPLRKPLVNLPSSCTQHTVSVKLNPKAFHWVFMLWECLVIIG